MKLLDFLKGRILVLDGGMGTLLQAEGLAPGELPERWCVSRPEVVTAIHRRYFEAGSHAVSANTFGANRLKFDAEELDAVIGAAFRCARAAADEAVGDGPRFVGLDIGPTGRMLAPFGYLDFEDAVTVFAETVRLGVKHGADFILIETMSDGYEAKAALLAAKENSDLPVFVSGAFGRDGTLMTGADAAAFAARAMGEAASVDSAFLRSNHIFFFSSSSILRFSLSVGSF